jgi:hypothetical protein
VHPLVIQLPKDFLSPSIAQLTHKFLSAWQAWPGDFPSGLKVYSRDEQEANRSRVQTLMQNTPGLGGRGEMALESDRLILRKQVRSGLSRILGGSLDPAMQHFLDDCEGVGKSFARAAKSFDHSIDDGDVLQALRNQWVFNSIQGYLSQPVSMTESSFAYSMLYPYTDNRIDDLKQTDVQKESFVRWLSLRLRGVEREADGAHTVSIHRLIGMVEHQYPRPDFPEVYHSLMAIHEAQGKSLLLHRDCSGFDEEYLLALTFEKGGTSVLTDGVLATGSLTPLLAEAMFAYGVVLQCVDDLQDVDEDRCAGHSTAFTRALERGPLDEPTNQLLWFVFRCCAEMNERAEANKANLCLLIRESCLLLALEAIARHRALYSCSYLSGIERHLPLPIDYFGALKPMIEGRLNEHKVFREAGMSRIAQVITAL